MNKRDPDEGKLHKSIKILYVWHQRICAMYDDITKNFDKSADILERITNHYFQHVLNIPERSPFHVIKPP